MPSSAGSVVVISRRDAIYGVRWGAVFSCLPFQGEVPGEARRRGLQRQRLQFIQQGVAVVGVDLQDDGL